MTAAGRISWRALALCAAFAFFSLLAPGCKELQDCRPGTLFVKLKFPATGTAPNRLTVSVAVDGGTLTAEVPYASGETLEIELPEDRYVEGAAVTVTVVALADQTELARASKPVTLPASCGTLELDLGDSSDLGVPDGEAPGDGPPASSDMGKKANGATCTKAEECVSNLCVDGYCCNAACTDQCEACDVAGSEGTCVPVSGAPHGTRAACTADPDVCGGTCDGVQTTQCSYPTVECRAASCTDGVATAAAKCDQGTCPAPVTTTCAGGICGATGCTTVTQISAGMQFTCALMADTTVRCWGDNTRGKLGLGETDTDERNKPTPVPGLSGVTQISAGIFHACALLQDQTVVCWGDNSYGQLGRNNKDNLPHGTPMPVMNLTGARSISAGWLRTCATVTNGARCWGINEDGMLGNGNTTEQYLPQPVCASGMGPSCTQSSFLQISVGANHTCGYGSNNVRCWGGNGSGQLGITPDFNAHPNPVVVSGLTSTGVVPTAVSAAHGETGGFGCARLSNSTARCWGRNNKGQLGRGVTSTESATPEPVCEVYNAGACQAVLSNVTEVSVGDTFACAINGGAVKCWGENNQGQLGNGLAGGSNTANTTTIASGAVQISAGYYHACALLSDGTVRCWGFNNYGQLGDGTSMNRNTPVSPVW